MGWKSCTKIGKEMKKISREEWEALTFANKQKIISKGVCPFCEYTIVKHIHQTSDDDVGWETVCIGCNYVFEED